MKLCIGFLFQNEADWLKLHLPVWCAADIDGLVAVDGGSSDDSADVARSFGATITERPFDWNFAAQGNALIEACERAGYDAMLRLDPDEVMFPESINLIRCALVDWPKLSLPRFNFVRDRYHYAPDWYPDHQQRAWWLKRGVRYPAHLRVHEVPEGIPALRFNNAHIYHYGWIKDADVLGQKSVKYAQVQGRDVIYQGGGEYPSYKPFPFDIQPQDPAEIGARAPVG
ncbi:MAG: hypothetical protein K8L99_02535 [Anaerolineae bacterium]|nr:hypothetical protein [Anaerolineae bacterium]